MTELALSDIRLRFGSKEALKGVSLTADDGKVAVLLGPSGSGKSALLRAIAGSNAQRKTQAAPHADPIAALLAPSNQAKAPPQSVPAPPAPSARIKAVQRALDDFAYGPVSATGAYDADTRAAIERFERSRGLPVTGQISDRLVRELGGMVGRPLE